MCSLQKLLFGNSDRILLHMSGYKLVLNELFHHTEELNCRGNSVFVMVKNRVPSSLGNHNLYIYIFVIWKTPEVFCVMSTIKFVTITLRNGIFLNLELEVFYICCRLYIRTLNCLQQTVASNYLDLQFNP